MNEKKVTFEFEDQIGRSFGAPEIDRAFSERLETELLRRADLRMARRARIAPRLRWGLGLSTAALLMALFLFASPQGQALAETIGHLFRVATVTEIPIEDPSMLATPTFASGFAVTLAPVVTAAPTSAPAPVQSGMPDDARAACEDEPDGYACNLYWAELRAGYDLKELPADPQGMRFMEYYVWENHDVQITYTRVTGGSYLFISQGMGGEFRPTVDGVPEDAIQAVEVNGFAGEYVVGNYFAGPGETAYKWLYTGTYRLRWADGERWYEMRYEGCAGSEDRWCTAEGLIALGESLVDKPVTETAPGAVCEDDPYGYACKIYWAEKRAGFDIREFASDPIDMRFREIHVEENKDVYIRYERVGGGTYLVFNQGLGGEFGSGATGVPAEAIQPVMVGEYPGEYADGSYVALSGAKTFTWQADASRYSLRWREDDRWYEIQYWGCVGREDYCNAEGLVQLALTLVDRPLPETGLRADYLKSVVEAEEISGLDLLEPTILPEDFIFSYGTFNADNGQVMLSYKPVGYSPGVAEISIRQDAGDMVPLPPIEEKFETVDFHGYPAFYQSTGPYSHWLTWQENGKIISLAVVSSDLWYGGTFTREQVLEIARSMQ